MKQIAIAAALTACVVSTGHADILLTYDESAATPRFEISNDSACATGAMEVLIDLESSAAELFFDNRTTGANLFDAALAPFRIESGRTASAMWMSPRQAPPASPSACRT